MAKDTGLRPVIKWAGGKRRLLGSILPLIPDDIGTYCEPFVGGGAVWLALQPEKAVVNDMNTDLIDLYWTMADGTRLEAMLDLLRVWPDEKDFFLSIRAWDRDPSYFTDHNAVQRAARLVYLNRTCFNGLFRVNGKGQFNVPYNAMDRHKRPAFDPSKFRGAGEYLQSAKIACLNGDFSEAIGMVRDPKGFCYIDPPYDSEDGGAFTSYQGQFCRDDQRRLKKACDEAGRRGVRVLVSNADTLFIRHLWDGYDIMSIQAPRSISADGGKRKKAGEVLIKNY